jgi:anti-sigma regulatory factor (Ser/Thr protein kinase)
VSWDARFAEPIVLPDSAKLATLRQAIAHLVKTVPATERQLPDVLTAAEMLTNAAEHGGPIEFARIATLRALNRHHVRQFTDRKDPHWGRRKLARDR